MRLESSCEKMPTVDKSPVEVLLDSLTDSIVEVTMSINDLERRLTPVLQPRDVAECSSTDKKPEIYNIGQRVVESLERRRSEVENILYTVASIKSRLEI